MEIDTLVLGEFETNCYVVSQGSVAQQCLVIDPGFAAEPLLDLLKEKGLCVVQILLTHGHCGHIAGVQLLRAHYDGVPIAISAEDAAMLNNEQRNLSWMMGMLLRLGDPERTLKAHDEITLGELVFEVLPTPGHTPGGISFYCAAQQAVFSGDTLFAGSIGRDDFPGGNRKVLLESIREQLFSLPDETQVYPGHGPATTISVEKRTNPFLISS